MKTENDDSSKNEEKITEVIEVLGESKSHENSMQNPKPRKQRSEQQGQVGQYGVTCGLSNDCVTRPTDQQTDQPTDTASYRGALSHLKRIHTCRLHEQFI